MANRHLGRTLVLQTLFEWDFNAGKKDMLECLEHVFESFAPDYDDNGFTKGLVNGVIEHIEELNGYITKFAKDWPLDQINTVDRNVLRIGVYELKYSSLPHKVIINEAIELAKAYGGPSSGKFINGVLGSVYRELEGEGILPRPSAKEELVVTQYAAGGVVMRESGEGTSVLLIKDGIGKFTFPKGKISESDDLIEATKREVEEETGISDMRVYDKIGEIQVTVNEPDKEPVRKLVHYHLVTTDQEDLQLKIGRGVTGGGWVTLEKARDIISYANARDILDKAVSAYETLRK